MQARSSETELPVSRETRRKQHGAARCRLLNLLTALSLLLCVAAVALWVRSYLRTDTVCVARGHSLFYGESSRGGVALAWHTRTSHQEPVIDEARKKGWAWQTAPGRDRYMGIRRTFGFAWYHSAKPTGAVNRVAHVPVAAILLVAACLPVVSAARWWRGRRRKRPGLCPACGYDLRATPGRCPECGREAAAAASA